ncbi:hypothetical protein [Rhodococcus jostii]|uniref:hypothetical protein n=1 Tax=Rhodococcus jostii TaxID=132919 RepID=UPI0036454F02
MLEQGSDSQTVNASRIALGEHLRPNTLNVPDDMLDLGARGLEFFELFLPAATRLGYESRELADYYARFDAERGMRLHTRPRRRHPRAQPRHGPHRTRREREIRRRSANRV